MKSEDGRQPGKEVIMSTYITSDCTVLAIVAGLKKYKMTTAREQRVIADALRAVNEQITWKVWERGEELALDQKTHQKIDWKLNRKFSDEEIWESCKCWLYQVDNNVGVSFDFITMIAAVKLLKERLEKEHLADKTWKTKCFFGRRHFFTYDEETESWNDIDKQVQWDLAA